MTPVISPPMRKEILRRREVGEVVGRADDVGGDVGRERRDAEREHRDDEHDRVLEAREHIDRIPDRLAVDDVVAEVTATPMNE